MGSLEVGKSRAAPTARFLCTSAATECGHAVSSGGELLVGERVHEPSPPWVGAHCQNAGALWL
ncbi:UNVERIFIED_CONTAM: hypothetical protein Sangu_1967800 [Sesamum angustifolium]|uniref:Uncharacterized protein n=1 Tax=Sesamum angustifolium TaxID=2727405 RepID=A0AAW2LY77_9LAMI